MAMHEAKKRLGLGPVTDEDIERLTKCMEKDEKRKVTKAEVEKTAVLEFLKLELKYMDEAIDSLEIENISKKDKSEIVWVTFADSVTVKAIFRRASLVSWRRNVRRPEWKIKA